MSWPTSRKAPGRVSPRGASGRELVLPLALFASLAWITWRRSGDPIIDWGRELYVAWSVAESRGIPADAVRLFGPLSPEFNGALMRVFGSTMAPILLANLIVLLVAALCVWILGRTLFRSAVTGQLALLAFLLLSGFSQFSRLSSFNFVTPYSHGITHGTTLGLLMVAVLVLRPKREHRVLHSYSAGVLCGLAILTKPEVGLAAGVTLAFAALLPPIEAEGGVCSKLWAAAGLGTSLLLATVYLGNGPDTFDGVAAILAPYVTAMSGELRDSVFYRRSMGLDRPAAHVLTGVLVLATYATVVGLLIRYRDRLAATSRRTGLVGRGAATVLGFAAAVTVTLTLRPMSWALVARVLPFAVLGILVGYCLPVLRRTSGASIGRRTRARGIAILCVFSLGMLLKLGVHSRFVFYGFALAAPATLLGVGCVEALVPLLVRRRYGPVPSVRTVGRFLILYLVAMSGILTVTLARVRDYPVGSDRDTMYLLPPHLDSRSRTVAEALEYLETVSRDGDSISFLPEGGILPYLLRSPSPTGLASLMPPELRLFGAGAVIDRLRAGDPERVVLLERSLDAYGYPTFPPGGEAYQPVLEWIHGNYCSERVFRHGAPGGPAHVIRSLRQC